MGKVWDDTKRLLLLNYTTIIRAITFSYFFIKRLMKKTEPVVSRVTRTYPKSYHLIPENPNEGEFHIAWLRSVGTPYHHCDYVMNGNYLYITSDDNSRHRVVARLDIRFHLTDYRHYTETPTLRTRSFYYEGSGCTWDTDDNGVRFHKIDKWTGLPVYWEEIYNVGVIFNYLNNQRLKEKIKPTKQLNRHTLI